ncbi:hypothetical protein QTP88_017259 [Uroleucon formosanum]
MLSGSSGSEILGQPQTGVRGENFSSLPGITSESLNMAVRDAVGRRPSVVVVESTDLVNQMSQRF